MSFYPNQLQPYAIAGAGALMGATTITLRSMLDINGNSLTMATAFGAIGYATIEPGNGDNEEQISFTGLTNNVNGTTTLTGVSSVSFGQPYTSTSGLTKTHAGNSIVVISNTSGFYNQFPAKQNNETVTGNWAVPDPVSDTDIANKQWVLSVVNGGAVSTNSVIVAGTAGETIAAGNLIYQKVSDGFWYKTSASTASTVDNVRIGIAQGSGTATSSITGGVLINGVDTHQSGLVAGTIYYASNTSGAIASSAGTNSRAIGQALNATSIYFDPYFKTAVTGNQSDALAGTSGTPSASNKFVTQTDTSLITPPGSVISYAGRSAISGWLICDGSAVSRTTYANLFAAIAPSKTFTVTVASPAVFTSTSHGLVVGDKVSLTTTGALPTGLATNTDYYVISAGYTADTFQLSTSRGGAAVNTSGSQNGVHTVYATNFGKGDGSTTFNVPDMRGFTPYGYKSSDANFDVINVPNTYVGEKTHQLTVTELASHTHTAKLVSGSGSGAFNASTNSATSIVDYSEAGGSTGGDTAHNNMPPYVVTNWLIKT